MIHIKRKGYLYENTYKLENIIDAYNEVCRNTRNKRKVDKYKYYKCIYISRVYDILKNKQYVPGPYNKFTIYEPKKRVISSQGMVDKTINHLVARHILYPALLPCLLNENVASRSDLGTTAGINLRKSFDSICKRKYGEYYVSKCDISKFFYSINHDILKNKLAKRIKDKDALKIVFQIIDSESAGVNIGSMTSQVFAIFYLNDMDHFIKEQLKIKYYVRYQDDFLLYHPSKQYLKYCFSEIKQFLEKEKLVLNKKTRLFKNTNNFIFLGNNKQNKYSKYRVVKRKLKKQKYLYFSKKISLHSLASSIINYEGLCNKNIDI